VIYDYEIFTANEEMPHYNKVLSHKLEMDKVQKSNRHKYSKQGEKTLLKTSLELL
jgi:hypothetical protein